ncbi:MAG: TIGR03086 family metal-binding protein [Ilumatobacteraceae bacterium]
MSANLRQYISAVYAFEHVLKMAKPTAFTRKAPCAGWTGKDVYEHGIGNLAMIKSFATTGKGPKRTPKLGADPVGAWVKLRDQTLEALDHAHVLQTVVHDPFGPDFGPMPMDDLVGFMAADLAPHTWDLARTAKVDERLDPSLVKHTMAIWKSLPEDVLRMPGMMAPAIKPAAGADAQTKLLNFLGRAV